MTETLPHIIQNEDLHARWLNTLSFMENAGARKISACEHFSDVGIIQLKHAAEEHRHAYYLKKQISKINPDTCTTYRNHELLAPGATRYYLHTLDIHCSRYLKQAFQLQGADLKYAAYLFVTYAIEMRADVLYPIYQNLLSDAKQRVMVKSIIVEEEGHLEDMTAQLNAFRPDWKEHAAVIQSFEQKLFDNWMNQINADVFHESH